MDQDTHENKAIVRSLGHLNRGVSGNSSGDSSNSDNGVVLENQVVLNPGDTVNGREESRDFHVNINGLELAKRMGDKDAGNGKGIGESLDEGTSENSNNLVNEVVLERMIVINSGEIVSISRENNDLPVKIDELGLNGRAIQVGDQEACIRREKGEALDRVEQESHQNSSISVNGVVLETVIIVNSEDNAANRGGNEQLEVKGSELGPSKVMVGNSKTKISKGEKQSCVIDMKCGVGGGSGGGVKDWDGEMVCRICHLSSEGLAETTATTSSMDLIQLGCGCKDDLGIAHVYCAEAWFKLKGNR